jgi:hypothetical protein
MGPVFIIDTNVFIQAHRMTYPLDIVPGFWTKMADLAEREIIISIDKVKEEIFKNDDELKRWCTENLPAKFWQNSVNASDSYAKVAEWAVQQNQRYTLGAIQDFLSSDVADAFVVAYALCNMNSHYVVTYEVESNKKGRIKIPDACKAFQIKYLNPIKMFRMIGEGF